MNKEITALDLILIIKKRLILIILFCISGVLLSALLTFYVATPKYDSTSQLLVAHSRMDITASSLNVSTNLQLINTYKDIIRGPVILEEVRDSLNLDTSVETLAEQVKVVNQDDSQVFQVVVTDESPEEAALIANTVAETFQNNIWDIMNIDNVTIIARATPNVVPTSPNVLINLAAGFFLSFVMGFGVAILIDWRDNTIKDEETIENELGWSTLGEIIEYTEKEAVKYDEEKLSETHQPTPSIRTRI